MVRFHLLIFDYSLTISVRIAVLMMGWGVMTMILGAVHSFAPLIVVRFLLGAFEAGLFPGMVYCLTFWYKQDERALRTALILACATLGALVSLIPPKHYSKSFLNRWSIRRSHRLWSRAYEWSARSARLEMALPH
jgi:MFS family permease